MFGTSTMLVKTLGLDQTAKNVFHIAFVTFLCLKSTYLWTWSLDFVLIYTKKLTSPSIVRVQVSSDFIQCNFFRKCSLVSTFSVASAVKCFRRICDFHLTGPREWICTHTVETWNSCSIRVFCSSPFYCTLGWIGTRTRQSSISSTFRFSFSGTLVQICTRIIFQEICP